MEKQSAIAQLNDIQLLEHLCSSEDDQHPYNQFVVRFLPTLKDECKRICGARKLDQHVGEQIAHETFERVRKYKSFKKDSIKIPNDRKAILVYLKKISIRLFNDHHSKEKNKDVQHKTYFDSILEACNSTVDVKGLKNNKDTALLIFKKLNKKEQKVVLKDIEYKKHQKYLPDDVTAALANELGVKQDTIRKIRLRAIKKIKDAIDEINQN